MLKYLIFAQILIKITTSFKCECSNSGIACLEECDTGTYCYTTWIVLGGDVVWQGCKTTRTDLLSSRQCQTNRKGLVTCVCDSEKCNDASFSVASDAALIVPKTVKCFNMDLNQDNFCFGHYCTFSMEMIINDFGDLIPTDIRAYRGCSDEEYSADLNSVNMCSISGNVISCRCNSSFCNREAAFPVSLGHLCYLLPTDYQGQYARGCLSVSDGAPVETKKSGNFERYKYCDKDLCNGEFLGEGFAEN
ncbi:hypothetical protein L5515_006910 [Caenorhabditis briggsae]|uniref:DUF7622 domain-containing protein n=1 Tax=Caenorhabditis briggsae TaxID=6238 RepID=A0AAE9EX23_CAEBR|nr:hypothetical protein L5515_006910 [Caenorhabditis briggsae]